MCKDTEISSALYVQELLVSGRTWRTYDRMDDVVEEVKEAKT